MGQERGVERRGQRRLALVCYALALILTACGGGSGTSSPAITAPPTLTAFPLIPTSASLAERLHLHPTAPGSVALIVQPDDARPPILNALNNAQVSIDLMIYLLTDRDTITALKNASYRGVAVRVMMEPNPCCARDNAMERSVFAELQEARAQVQWTNPAFRLTHAKTIVIDGAMALVMSQNLTKSSFMYNREASILTRDPSDVAAVQAVFVADWERGPYTARDPNLVVANTNARTKLLALIGGATKSLDIESEELQDAAIEDALIGAQKRGVAVRFIGSQPPPSSSGPPQQDTNALGRKHIMAGGAAVRIVATPYMHTKTIVADGAVAYVGSVNLSAASMDTNRELGLLTDDTAIINRLKSVFAKDWSIGKPEA